MTKTQIVSIAAVLSLLLGAGSSPARSQTDAIGDAFVLEIEVEPGGSWSLKPGPARVAIVLPPGTPKPDLSVADDPLRLVERIDWRSGENESVLNLVLAAGILGGVERRGDSVRLIILPSLDRMGTYMLGPDDLLGLTIFGEPDLSGELIVDPAGEVKVGLIGSVKAEGLTSDELAAAIRDALGRDFLTDPLVTVEVMKQRDRYVTVVGPVARGGSIPVKGPTPMSRILSLAGGFLPLNAGMTISVSRVGEDGTAHSFLVDRLALEAGEQDPVLLPDDLVTVSEPELVFIDGEVGSPGVLTLTPGLTLLRALALARGVSRWANEGDVQIHRQVGGQRILETHNLKRIRAHKAPDPLLRASDMIIVPRRFL